MEEKKNEVAEGIHIEDDKPNVKDGADSKGETILVETPADKKVGLTFAARSGAKTFSKTQNKSKKKGAFNAELIAKRNRNAPVIVLEEMGDRAPADKRDLMEKLKAYNTEMKSVTPLLVICIARKGSRQHVSFPSMEYKVTPPDSLILMTQETWANATRADKEGYYKADYASEIITSRFTQVIREDDPLINERKYLRLSNTTGVVSVGRVMVGDRVLPGYKQKCFVMKGESKIKAELPEITEIIRTVKREKEYNVVKVQTDLKPAPWEALAKFGFALKGGDRDRIAAARQAAKVLKLNYSIPKNYAILKERGLTALAGEVSDSLKVPVEKISQYLVISMCNETFIKHLTANLVPITTRNIKHYDTSRFDDVNTEEKAKKFAQELADEAGMGDYATISSEMIREESTKRRNPTVRST